MSSSEAVSGPAFSRASRKPSLSPGAKRGLVGLAVAAVAGGAFVINGGPVPGAGSNSSNRTSQQKTQPLPKSLQSEPFTPLNNQRDLAKALHMFPARGPVDSFVDARRDAMVPIIQLTNGKKIAVLWLGASSFKSGTYENGTRIEALGAAYEVLGVGQDGTEGYELRLHPTLISQDGYRVDKRALNDNQVRIVDWSASTTGTAVVPLATAHKEIGFPINRVAVLIDVVKDNEIVSTEPFKAVYPLTTFASPEMNWAQGADTSATSLYASPSSSLGLGLGH